MLKVVFVFLLSVLRFPPRGCSARWSFQVAALRHGDVERVGGGEEVSLVRGAVVVRRQVRVQQGGQREVGRAFLQALGVEVEEEVQLVLYGLYLVKHTHTYTRM